MRRTYSRRQRRLEIEIEIDRKTAKKEKLSGGDSNLSYNHSHQAMRSHLVQVK